MKDKKVIEAELDRLNTALISECLKYKKSSTNVIGIAAKIQAFEWVLEK